jgi:hypothetical protein
MIKSNSRHIAILTSIIGYGIYFPSLITRNDLESKGFKTSIYVVERYFSEEKLQTFKESRIAFKKNFKVARIAAQLPLSHKNLMNTEKINKLYREWELEGVDEFLCFSGLWFPILEKFFASHISKPVNCCKIDAGISPAWKDIDKYSLKIANTFKFFNLDELKINYQLRVPQFQPVCYEKRSRSVMMHGGGWGLGNYIKYADNLKGAGYEKKIMIHHSNEYVKNNKGFRYFMNDPDWDPLLEASKYHKNFPRLGEFAFDAETISYKNFDNHHGSLKVIQHCMAIVSKPGGMTLLDVLTTETPLVYLIPMGPNEEGNKRICEHLGLGISFENWEKSNFSSQILHECSRNIHKLKKKLPDFLSVYES